MPKMVSWSDAMDFANAVAFASGWNEEDQEQYPD